MIEWAGWIGTFFALWGILLIGSRRRYGFLPPTGFQPCFHLTFLFPPFRVSSLKFRVLSLFILTSC